MDTCQIKVCGVNQLVTDGGNLSFTFIHSFPRCQSWVGIFEESFTSVWKLGECISIKIKSWIAESDFSFRDARVPRGKPSTPLQALVGENQNLTKTSMLLLRYRNQRITIVSTPLSPLWIRSWPKLRINSVEITLSYSPTSHSFDSLWTADVSPRSSPLRDVYSFYLFAR